jgi:plasmid stabilization system protein ParE
MRVRWLRTALRNLDDEATYIAIDDTSGARLVVKRVLAGQVECPAPAN